jgi:DNA-binding IclR family transcriptional regulator
MEHAARILRIGEGTYNRVVHSATSKSKGDGAMPRENVDAVSRALALLDAFVVNEHTVSLTELSRRLGMQKSTVLRTARTLARSDYLTQTENGRWRLGPAAGWLGVRYQTSFDVDNIIDSLLRKLSVETGETAAFFVREGDLRTCVARVDRVSLQRVHLRVGEKLPLETGASGRVLLAFSERSNPAHEGVRRKGYYISVGERDTRLASIAIPVFGDRRSLFGAICISGETQHLPHDVLLSHLPLLIAAGASLSRALSRVGPQSAKTTSGHKRI